MAPSPRRKTALAANPSGGNKPAASGKPTGPTPRPDPRTLNREARRREGRGNRGGQGNRGNRKPPAFPSRSAFYGQDTEQQGNTMADVAGYFGIQAMKGAQGYDPNNPYAGMSEQGFQGQLDQARQSVMDQFERSMGPQFAREEQEFRQRMAEQGIDPNSGAFQAQYKSMKEAQDAARQGAQAQAFQLGAQYQQQGFQQGMQGRMMPFEQLSATAPYFTLPYQTGMAGRQQEAQRQFEGQQAEANRRAAMEQAQLAARTSMGTAQLGAQTQRDIATMNMVNSQYGNQGQQSIPWYNAAIAGLAQGAGAGIVNYMGRTS